MSSFISLESTEERSLAVGTLRGSAVYIPGTSFHLWRISVHFPSLVGSIAHIWSSRAEVPTATRAASRSE